ncbi:MAG: glycosyltransferase [bacterium]
MTASEKLLSRKKIAFWHRYGPADHIIAGGHCIPRLIDKLSPFCEVHYFGLKTRTRVHNTLQSKAILHYLPYTLNRSSMRGKMIGTLIWYLALPFISLRCRLMKVDVVFMDETLPLTPLIARLFFGRTIAITVADFFINIYFKRYPLMRPVTRLIEELDYYAWRRLPLIFTKVRYTRTFLVGLGVPFDRICPVYNPCDTHIYFPSNRDESRKAFNIPAHTLVLVHHGVLHPNKGNDRIIRALAEIQDQLPDWRFLLIGSGPELEPLKALSRDLGLSDRIIFTGWLPGEKEVNRALNAGDIGLVMRIGQSSDDFHLTDTLVHEMAIGLPILSARLKGIEEIITDGQNGLLFDPQDMSEFKAKLLELAGDEQKRKEFGIKAGELCAQHFDIDKAATAMAIPLLALAGIKYDEALVERTP